MDANNNNNTSNDTIKKLEDELKEKDKMIKDFDILCEKKDAKLKLQSEKIDLSYQKLRDMKHLAKIGDLVTLSDQALDYSARTINFRYITQWGLIVSCLNEYRVEEERNGNPQSALKFVELISSIVETEPPKPEKKIKKVVVKDAKHYEIEGDLDIFDDENGEEPPFKSAIKYQKKKQIGGVKNLFIDKQNDMKEEEMGAEIVKDYSAEELYPKF